MVRLSFPGSNAMKKRIAQWSASWQETPEVASMEQPSSGNAQVRQQPSLSTREVVESLNVQWSKEQDAELRTP